MTKRARFGGPYSALQKLTPIISSRFRVASPPADSNATFEKKLKIRVEVFCVEERRVEVARSYGDFHRAFRSGAFGEFPSGNNGGKPPCFHECGCMHKPGDQNQRRSHWKRRLVH